MKINLVFISGTGRSGSTLLDRMLGQIDGYASSGEMWLLWERGCKNNELCSCGERFRECPFWKKILEGVSRSLGQIDCAVIAGLQSRIMRMRYIPYMLMPILRPRWYKDMMQEYTKIIVAVYSAILETSGSDVVVDSSKMPLYGLLLHATGVFELGAIHLVRNSLAVAYSWQRKRVRKEIPDKIQYMPTPSVVESAVDWIKSNLLSEILGTVARKSVRIKYEDLVVSPGAIIKRGLTKMGYDNVKITGLEETTLALGPNHIPSGNPMRFRSGKLDIKEDNEWKERMPIREKVKVILITWPLLLKYQYLFDSLRTGKNK